MGGSNVDNGTGVFTTRRCKGLALLNQSLVESEIQFGRTVLFSSEIDLTGIDRMRAAAAPGATPSYTAFVAKAVARALKEFPYANRRIYRPFGLPFLSYFQAFHDTDVAVAIERDLPGEYSSAYIEVLRDVDTLALGDITLTLRKVATMDLSASEQWRSFHRIGTKLPGWLAGFLVGLPVHLPEMWKKYRGGAAMISSPAKYGVDGIVGAWTHPLGFSFGLAQMKPVVKDGQVVARNAFTFAMNWDRRVMAGAQAARFFSRICELLREPATLGDAAPSSGLGQPVAEAPASVAAQRKPDRETATVATAHGG